MLCASGVAQRDLFVVLADIFKCGPVYLKCESPRYPGGFPVVCVKLLVTSIIYYYYLLL